MKQHDRWRLYDIAPPQQRPPSPTELSYTQLAKLAPPLSSSRRGNHHPRNNDNGVSNDITSSRQVERRAPVSVPGLPAAPRTPPASISVPRIDNSNVGGPINQYNYQTPQTTQTMLPVSAPLQYTAQPGMADQINHRSTPMEDRVSNLASTLQAMQTPTDQQFNSSFTPLPHSQQQQQQLRRSNRFSQIHQFIDTLKNMQMAVSNTVDEQQRVKKSRALNALLSMFESIIEEQRQQASSRVVQMDPTAQISIQRLEQRVKHLEGENEQLNLLIQERDGQLQQMEGQLQLSQHDLQHLAIENEQLKCETNAAEQQCNRERQRAQEAESVAAESENVRNSLLANYAAITEENVELQRATQDVNLEKEKMVTEFELCQQEMTTVQSQCDQLSQQLQQKDLSIIALEKKVADLNDQLIAQQNLLQSANADRQRLQDELHSSHRNSTTASEQLIQLRDQFSQFRRDADTKKHQQRSHESEYDIVHTKLQEEQRRRVELETQMSQSNGNDAAALEQIRKMSKANDDLKTRMDEMRSRMSRPMSGMSVISSGGVMSLNGVNSIANDQIGEGSVPVASDAISSRLEISQENEETKTKATALDSPPGDSICSIGPRSLKSVGGELSLNGIDEMDSIMNERAVDGNATSQRNGTRKEDTHPNLMDYFYKQIKLCE